MGEALDLEGREAGVARDEEASRGVDLLEALEVGIAVGVGVRLALRALGSVREVEARRRRVHGREVVGEGRDDRALEPVEREQQECCELRAAHHAVPSGESPRASMASRLFTTA